MKKKEKHTFVVNITRTTKYEVVAESGDRAISIALGIEKGKAKHISQTTHEAWWDKE